MSAEEERAQAQAIEDKAYRDMNEGAREVQQQKYEREQIEETRRYEGYNESRHRDAQTRETLTDLKANLAYEAREAEARRAREQITAAEKESYYQRTPTGKLILDRLRGKPEPWGAKPLPPHKPATLYSTLHDRSFGAARDAIKQPIVDINEGRRARQDVLASRRGFLWGGGRQPVAIDPYNSTGLYPTKQTRRRKATPSAYRSREITFFTPRPNRVASRSIQPRTPSLLDDMLAGFGRMPMPTTPRAIVRPGRQTTRQVSILDSELKSFFPSGLPTNAKKRKKASTLYDDEFGFMKRFRRG